MARQIQLRRGTAKQHEQFIGADGEITMDTTNKTLRVHDGTTPGGVMLARAGNGLDENADYVIEFQRPTAENNYTWYRKYKSGWVEQGGITQSQTIVLPLEMSDSRYHIQLTSICEIAANNVPISGYKNVTTTGFTVQCNILNNAGNSVPANNYEKTWFVNGFCA